MSKKPYIYKRIIAYVLDILIISVIATVVTIPFSNNKEYVEISKELTGIVDKYKKEEIKEDKYLKEVEEFNYKLTKANMPQTIAVVVVSVLYFVGFNYYYKGQTLGKKVMKLRIVGNDENKLSINNYIIRMLVVNPALSNIVTIILILTLSKEKYLMYEGKLSSVFGILYIICFIFALYRNDGKGLHDLLAGTIVIDDKEKNDQKEIKEAVIVSEKKDKEVK